MRLLRCLAAVQAAHWGALRHELIYVDSGSQDDSVPQARATGATVLSGLDHLPLSVNVWRCFMMWVGGLGIIVLAVAILPLLGVGGTQLFRAETAGPLKDQKLTPRIAETARGLWVVRAVRVSGGFMPWPPSKPIRG